MSTKESLVELSAARSVIDKCDEEIIAALAARMKAVTRIGLLKKNLGKDIRDDEREWALKERRRILCKQFGVSQIMVETLFSSIVEHSRKIQGELDDSKEPG